MSKRITTQKDVNDAVSAYGSMLMNFVTQFTGDELKTRRILFDLMWDIPALMEAEPEKLGRFARMLQFTRKFVLERLEGDPLFDPWAMWDKEPDFFPLTNKCLTHQHRQFFWYRYYRDRSEADIAFWLELSIEEIKQIAQETYLAISHVLISQINNSTEVLHTTINLLRCNP